MPLGNRSRRKDILQPFRIFYSLGWVFIPSILHSESRTDHLVKLLPTVNLPDRIPIVEEELPPRNGGQYFKYDRRGWRRHFALLPGIDAG